MSTIHTGDEWLSLSEAAEMLGIHPATVRLWADRNEIPMRRTSGGHRRFRRADIEARLRQDVEHRPRPAAQLLVQSVLGRVRFAFTDGTLNTFSWYAHFNEAAREGFRSLGRRVLELLLRALADGTSEDELRSEAVQLGKAYGAITRESHVPVADAVRAFLYFRSLVDESVLQLAEVRGMREDAGIYQAQTLPQVVSHTHKYVGEPVGGAEATGARTAKVRAT